MGAVALLLVFLAAVAPPALAQGPATGSASAEAASEARPSATAPPVDATKLGVSMARIQRGLRISEAREQVSGDGLRLEYQVQVFGTAPRIDIIYDFDIGQGAPLQYGAPTHNDFVSLWTPLAYRSPPIPFSQLASWAMVQLTRRSDKSKCEQEIAEYRATLMQGIPVAAPRCTQ